MTNNTAEEPCAVWMRKKTGTLMVASTAAIELLSMLTLITTNRLNDVGPQAWLADVLTRIAELLICRVHEL